MLRKIKVAILSIGLLAFGSAAFADDCSCYRAGYEDSKKEKLEPFDFYRDIPTDCAVYGEPGEPVPYGYGFVDGWRGTPLSEVEFCASEMGINEKPVGVPALAIRSPGSVSGGPNFECSGENISFNGRCYQPCSDSEFFFLDGVWGEVCVSCPFKASRVLRLGGYDFQCFKD